MDKNQNYDEFTLQPEEWLYIQFVELFPGLNFNTNLLVKKSLRNITYWLSWFFWFHWTLVTAMNNIFSYYCWWILLIKIVMWISIIFDVNIKLILGCPVHLTFLRNMFGTHLWHGKWFFIYFFTWNVDLNLTVNLVHKESSQNIGYW